MSLRFAPTHSVLALSCGFASIFASRPSASSTTIATWCFPSSSRASILHLARVSSPDAVRELIDRHFAERRRLAAVSLSTLQIFKDGMWDWRLVGVDSEAIMVEAPSVLQRCGHLYPVRAVPSCLLQQREGTGLQGGLDSSNSLQPAFSGHHPSLEAVRSVGLLSAVLITPSEWGLQAPDPSRDSARARSAACCVRPRRS
jgi:hypothetical protein